MVVPDCNPRRTRVRADEGRVCTVQRQTRAVVCDCGELAVREYASNRVAGGTKES